MFKALVIGLCLIASSASANELGEKLGHDIYVCITKQLSTGVYTASPALPLTLMRNTCHDEIHAWMEACVEGGQEAKSEGICGAEAVMQIQAVIIVNQ